MMNKKRMLLVMALSGALLPTEGLLAQSSSTQSPNRASSVGHIGDSASKIGDKSDDEISAAPDWRPASFRSNVVDAALPVDPLPRDSYIGDTHSSMIADDSPMQLTSFNGQIGSSGESCGGSCEVASCFSNPTAYWAELETLLWFSGERQTPPLVVQSDRGTLPVPGTVLAGGTQTIGDELQPGFRGGLGMWIDDCTGVGGRVFGLFGRDSSTTYTSDNTTGNQSLAVPFFNVSLGIPDAYLVGFDSGNLGINTGSITIGSKLDLIGGDAYLRTALMKSGGFRTDFVGGYLFTRLDDNLRIATQYTDNITNAVQNGTVISTTDTFSTENTFHGGNIGLIAESTQGPWHLSTAAKFGLGNMHQEVNVAGAYLEVPPGGGNVTDGRGLFAQRSNIGNQSRNVFAFIPQIDLKLGYQVRCNLRFDVGYSLLYFSNVALAGNQIDPSIDIANILQVPTTPGPRFVDDSLILHGVNLGLTYTY